LSEEDASLTWTLRISSLLISDQPQMQQLPPEKVSRNSTDLAHGGLKNQGKKKSNTAQHLSQ
jgi:hypothetical protein